MTPAVTQPHGGKAAIGPDTRPARPGQPRAHPPSTENQYRESPARPHKLIATAALIKPRQTMEGTRRQPVLPAAGYHNMTPPDTRAFAIYKMPLYRNA